MDYVALNGVKDVQVALQEAGLYSSAIDGVWGGGCEVASGKLFSALATIKGITGLTAIPSKSTAAAVILGIQTNLKKLGFYASSLDGVWGAGSRAGIVLAKEAFCTANKLPTFAPCWSTKVPVAFYQRIQQWVKQNNYPTAWTDYLMAIMCFESGGTFDPAKQNLAGAQAFGLIQFMKDAATDLKTTLADLVKMTQLEQLEYVFKYFQLRMKAYKISALEDFYLAVFYPAAIGKGPNTAIFAKGTKGYTQNAGLDADKDGQITVGEINVRIYQTYYQGMDVSNRRVN